MLLLLLLDLEKPLASSTKETRQNYRYKYNYMPSKSSPTSFVRAFCYLSTMQHSRTVPYMFWIMDCFVQRAES